VTERRRPQGRIVHAHLHLLDRQVVEHESGRLVAKVDDVELDLDAPVPTVTALLSGPGAGGPRLPGVVGRAVTGIHRRLHPAEEPEPTRIDWSHVVDIDSAIRVDRADLGPQGLGRWLDEHFVCRIPGARHEAD
jgi:sporulation protein YlmC with PRC-barrel domain